MAPSNKLNLKDKVEDGELDLSMSDLQEVPVKEIAQAKKANKLDLSNNRLVTLGKNFATLTHIVHLDLGNNKLKELPDNFGNLRQLKHLDLYNNQLKHLPLSFSQLKSLKWLDIKKNPLVPALAQVAGPCLDAQQCQQSAKRVVEFLAKMQAKVDDELNRRNNQKIKEIDGGNNPNVNAKQNKQQQKKNKKDANKTDAKNASKTNATNAAAAKHAKNHVDNKQPATKAKKPKTSKKQRKQSFISSVTWKFFTLVLIAFITLPILSYVHQEHVVKNTVEYQLVKRQFDKVWNITINNMPQTVLDYGEQAAIYTKPITDFVCSKSVIIFEMIAEARHSEQYKLFKIQMQQLFESLLNKISDLYKNIGSSSSSGTSDTKNQ